MNWFWDFFDRVWKYTGNIDFRWCGADKRWRTTGGGGAYFAKRLDEQLVTRGGTFKYGETRAGETIG